MLPPETTEFPHPLAQVKNRSTFTKLHDNKRKFSDTYFGKTIIGVKRIDIANGLGPPPSTLNTIIVKKNDIIKHAYVSVNQELATCGVLCVEEMCGALGSASRVEEVKGDDGGGDDDEPEPEPMPSFTEAFNVYEPMRTFIYAHNITKRDQAKIINIENVLFNFKRNVAAKEIRLMIILKINNTEWTLQWKQ
jgi:hypothetical protein